MTELAVRCELDFDEVRLALASVAEGMIVGRAEHPFLLVDIPLGPGIERHEGLSRTFRKDTSRACCRWPCG